MGMACAVFSDLVNISSNGCIVNSDLVKYLFLLPFFLTMVYNLFVLLRVFGYLHSRLVNARRIRNTGSVVESEREAELVTKKSEFWLFTSIILAFGFVKIPYAIFRFAFAVINASQFPYADDTLNLLWSIGATVSFSQGFLLVLITSKIYNLYGRLKEVLQKRKRDSMGPSSTAPISKPDIEEQTNSYPPPVGHDNNLDSLKSSDSEDGNEIPLQDMLTTKKQLH